MIPILDNGHGGMIKGNYQTSGKRSPDWDKGILYEGMFNRWVVNRLIEKLDRNSIPYYHVSPEIWDVNLQNRVDRINAIASRDSNTYLLSIHANAGGGTGIEGYTYPGQNTSDRIAEIFLSRMEKTFRDLIAMRFDNSDGDKDKEANFKLLRETKCPAFLFECGFMDNKFDYNLLWSESYLIQLVHTLYRSIEYIYKNKI